MTTVRTLLLKGSSPLCLPSATSRGSMYCECCRPANFWSTNPRIIEILGSQPVDISVGPLVDEQRRKAVAWEFFSRLVSPKIPSLDSRTVDQIAWLRQNKKRELDQLRLRCALLSHEVSPTVTQAEMTAQVEKLIATRASKEIADLFDLDDRSLRESHRRAVLRRQYVARLRRGARQLALGSSGMDSGRSDRCPFQIRG